MSSEPLISEENVLRILVATDIHLGYNEKKEALSDDSFTTFEEILEIACSRDVDFILLGGDLFHDPTPSPNSLNKCIKLLRTHVLGDKMIDFEFLSDQNQNFPDSFRNSVNYEDENLNVSIPVFSINGNHDDQTGTGRLSSMDILSSTGLLNYFGKWRDLSNVEISPIVLKKNETIVALYGLSHIHDARLTRLFRDHKVTIHKPNIPDEKVFNLMVLHQNRADRGRCNYLPEDKLPGFLDLVVWGHEHDCRIEPERNGKSKTLITQPGSSVATSLSEGESIEKQVGILEIHKTDSRLKPTKLKTVRPFIFRSINIDEFVEKLQLNEGDVRSKVEKFYAKNVAEMIEESKTRLTGHRKQPTTPLIRLRVLYTNENHMVNLTRFGQKYEKDVLANPESVLTFKKIIVRKNKNIAYNPDEAALKTAFDKKEQQDSVEDVVERYFNELENDKDKLKLFNLKSLSEICRLLVNNDDEDASLKILNKYYTKAVKFMEEQMTPEEDIEAALQDFQLNKSKETFNEAIVENSRVKTMKSKGGSDEDENSTSKSSTSKAPTRGRGARGRGKQALQSTSIRAANVNESKVASSIPSRTQRAKPVVKRSAASNISSLYADSSDSD